MSSRDEQAAATVCGCGHEHIAGSDGEDGGCRVCLCTTWRSPDSASYQDAVIEAAREFVATTTYWRQRKESRESFERLAFALLDLRKDALADLSHDRETISGG